MCDEEYFKEPMPCPVPECPKEQNPCKDIDFSETVKHYEIKVNAISVKYAEDDPPPRLTSMDYGQNYVYIRFVHPLLGRIETVPTQLKHTECGDWKACFDTDISVHVRTDQTSFWAAARQQEMAAYVFRKNQAFDEIAGVAAIAIANAKKADGTEAAPVPSPGSKQFNLPLAQPMPVPTPFCKGNISLTVSVIDLGEVPTPVNPCGPTPTPLKFDATKFYEGDLYDGVCRARANIEKYYRRQATYRPGEAEVRKEVSRIVDETLPIINSGEMAKILEHSEERTLLCLRRIENAMAECLRNAEDIREAVTCDDVSRGAINRVFEHLHTMYQDTMDTNVRASDGHFTYDMLSGLTMTQKLRGMAVLKQDMIDQANRLRGYVEREKPHELECFEAALDEMRSVHVPGSIQEIFDGSYFKAACTPAVREDEPTEAEAYDFCGDGPYKMHFCR